MFLLIIFFIKAVFGQIEGTREIWFPHVSNVFRGLRRGCSRILLRERVIQDIIEAKKMSCDKTYPQT